MPALGPRQSNSKAPPAQPGVLSLTLHGHNSGAGMAKAELVLRDCMCPLKMGTACL